MQRPILREYVYALRTCVGNLCPEQNACMPPVASTAVRSQSVVLLLLIQCIFLLPFVFVFLFGPYFAL